MLEMAHRGIAACSLVLAACSGSPGRLYPEPEAADGWTLETVGEGASLVSMAFDGAGSLRIAQYHRATSTQSVASRDLGEWQSAGSWQAGQAAVLVSGADGGLYVAGARGTMIDYGRYEDGTWRVVDSIEEAVPGTSGEGAVEDVAGVSLAAGDGSTIVSFTTLHDGPDANVLGRLEVRVAVIADGSEPTLSTVVESPTLSSLEMRATRVVLTSSGPAVYFLDSEAYVTEARSSLAGWTTERILDARSPSGFAVTTDALGTVHVAADVGSAIVHLRRDADEWRWEEVGAGRRPEIAVGPDGSVHVVYLAASESELWHARLRSDGWEHELVAFGSFSEAQIIVDPDLVPHVAFTHCDGTGCSVFEARPSP